ncbi:hypothetical protein QTO31_01730 [Chloroflexus sp. MS-CIW-1]|jgi:hypothetical protein|uniref:hypothetical protein n=1 Tax=Chloroflexus sp. MS-CIW-1 TaxID=3055768 RepID=UPI002648C90C|nr:hypothetical protein [Chloroflexus sp. MS-CIW-1]MDN5270685.1 hypothetical protein [Chloroflexus sp. MS-CIW-1]
MNNQTRLIGLILITIGVVAIFRLWWLVPVALLAGGGIVIYRRQRNLGRIDEAVQALLWGVGLALLSLFKLLWPGILILGGVSLLLRGREAEVEQRMWALLGQLLSWYRRPTTPPTSNKVQIVEKHDEA